MTREALVFSIPILTLSDPKITGEGILDPLGLARIADQLGDWILPGMTARMIRPRFLTCIAVAAAVCDGMDEEIAADGVSLAYLVFEWLMVEGFARAGEYDAVLRTPGIDKAREAMNNGIPLSFRSYLKTPTVFGIHGVYKRLARYLGILGTDLGLAENGYMLLKTWEREQGLDGFIEPGNGNSSGPRYILRDAVRDGLRLGYTQRSAGWQGWSLLVQHLAPAAMGRQEAEAILRLLSSGGSEPCSSELFRTLCSVEALQSCQGLESEAAIYERALAAKTSEELHRRFTAIETYEAACALFEEGFAWLRYLSSTSGARPLSENDYTKIDRIKELSSEICKRLEQAEQSILNAPPDLLKEFIAFAKFFDYVKTPEDLFKALLERHAAVQKAKPPEGKREWFEHGTDGSVFVRPAYRLTQPPPKRSEWGRPYRVWAARSFCKDLRLALS